MPKTYDEITLTPITYVPSDEIKTGSWRTFRPVIDLEKCVKCNICWKFCPDVAIMVKDEASYPEVNYDYCKGCGICANECPTKAIEMVKEV